MLRRCRRDRGVGRQGPCTEAGVWRRFCGGRVLTESAAADAKAAHAPGEAPQREGSLLRLVARWASSGESRVGSAGKTTATPSGAVYLLEGVVMVFSHSGQLQGCVGNAVAAWLMAVRFDNCRRCHGGLAGSNQAGAAVAPWWRGWWLLAPSHAVGCLSLAGGVGRDSSARVDDPIRPSGVCLL